MGSKANNMTLTNCVEPVFETMLLSDLHLEYADVVPPEFSAVAPILILAGDIGRPDIPSLQSFLLAQCERFEHIFYVAGNHCFYEGDYETRLQQLEQLNHLDPRIHFLHNRSYLLPNNVRVLGTTLWTHIPGEVAEAFQERFADYRLISTEAYKRSDDDIIELRRPITVEDTNEWHAHQYAWLVQEIREAYIRGEHVIVITHHAPVRHQTCSIPDKEAGLEDAYVNDHENACVDPVRLWVHGHTHRSGDQTINSTRIISNQLGYTNDCDDLFRPNLKISLFDDGSVSVTGGDTEHI